MNERKKNKSKKNNKDKIGILDEIIREARKDYTNGDYKSFDNVEGLINDLKS